MLLSLRDPVLKGYLDNFIILPSLNYKKPPPKTTTELESKPMHFCNTHSGNALLLLGEAGNEARRGNETEEWRVIRLWSPSVGSNHWSLGRSLLERPTVIGLLAVVVQGYHSHLSGTTLWLYNIHNHKHAPWKGTLCNPLHTHFTLDNHPIHVHSHMHAREHIDSKRDQIAVCNPIYALCTL